jgi:hypothetical protein
MDAIICPAGHYCPGVGNTNPVECYPGTYNPFQGKANCTVCPTGEYIFRIYYYADESNNFVLKLLQVISVLDGDYFFLSFVLLGLFVCH